MTDRFTASTINDDQLDALYAERDRLAAELAAVGSRASVVALEDITVRSVQQLTEVRAERDQLAATIARVRVTLETCKTSGRTGRGYYAEVLAALDGPQHTCPDGEPCPPHDEPAPGADAALARQRAAGYAAQADAIERTEHAELNRHHMRPVDDTQEH